MANPIVLENQLTGNPDTEWDLSGTGQNSGPGVINFIEGYATDISVNSGQTINFKINTNSNNYRGDIYRLGYYGGMGARKVATFQKSVASLQPAPVTDPVLGLVDAGKWTVTASWAVPSGAVSGVYIVHLVRQDSIAGENHIPFVVRNDGVMRDIVFQTSDTTWHAYNGWGGYNLYGGGATWDNEGRAAKVSYNRPIVTRDSIGTYAGPQDFLFGVEYAAIRWLEANGYDVCYIAGVDTDRRGSELLKHKLFLSVGHDEYWGTNQRANVQAARSAGVHLAFWSGNEVYWKCRWESSTAVTDGNPTANRTLVCYKETRQNAQVDPMDPTFWGGTWRDPRFSPPDDGGRPENALTGTMFQVDAYRSDIMQIPMTLLRFWRNTPLAGTAPGQTASLVRNLLGYEWDQSPDNGRRPGGLICLSSTTLAVNTYLLDYGSTTGPGVATHNLTLYKDPNSHAIVFGAGTVMWSWGLDSDHDLTATPTDPNVQQAMVNLLGDMGALAQTLQTGLVPWTQSTDTTAPTSTITFPTSSTSVVQNQTLTITGTASDSGGQVAGVEVSTDGGNTWHPANGTTSWSYNWTAPSAGTFTIRSRAVDDSLNLEAPGPGVSVTVSATTSVNLFSGTPSVVTENDAHAVELGVKFQTSQAGTVSGIRFYKGPQNTGTHVGNLWSATGTLLASTTFINETASGWQQANFSNPVSLTVGATYIASYHTNPGFYSADINYFNVAHTAGPLTAPATGSSGGNGVYAYGGNSSFPAKTFSASNYWVDVVFNPTTGGGNQPPVANDDSGFVTNMNTPLSIPASALLANDTDPNGQPLSIQSVSNPTNGTVSYNTSTQTVTFTPTGGYTGLASFTYTITDGSGTDSANVSLTVSAQATTASLFSPNNTPALITDNDPHPIELGVKFQSSATGRITAIRFYKGPQNTGTHTANLWSATGGLLGSATFTNETASGWQQVSLPSPGVTITSGTTYVASYHTNVGHYSVNENYFATALTSGPLTAPASSPSGGNGVYAYGTSSSFPTNTFNATNYWIDIVFQSP
jgi:Domain of unknown function (DUF4082)/Bacterial Ig domain